MFLRLWKNYHRLKCSIIILTHIFMKSLYMSTKPNYVYLPIFFLFSLDTLNLKIPASLYIFHKLFMFRSRTT